MAMLNNQVVGISSEYPAKISIFLEVAAPCCIGGLSILGVACKPRHGPEGLGTSKKSGQCHCCLGYHFLLPPRRPGYQSGGTENCRSVVVLAKTAAGAKTQLHCSDCSG